MAIDPNQWTQKTREGFIAAQELAKTESHPEVTPEHMLLALVGQADGVVSVSYTHLRAHETRHDLVCRLLLEKKK